ncbi:Dam family site-specific DNA-(adenine-N6)-methyltransferase [Sodaliphilus sp.]|uniref:Dam family site-specific DNA-(adenine-N6)-methyltransferase n=1 Tax=Sodaliphilus sp. TaxID=2815818 RepID=UPI00388FF1D5
MRYIGNKAKLLPFLEELLRKHNLLHKGMTFCDAFCGTATVSDYFQNVYRIIANDSLTASYYIAKGKLCRIPAFERLGIDPFTYFNEINTDDYVDGFCYNNFAPSISGRMYFSDENAKMIDFIRDRIDEWFEKKSINEAEKAYLIASLLESLSKVSNVAGVYSAFLRIWDPRAVKRMIFFPVERTNNRPVADNICHLGDVNKFIAHAQGDILYLDPPYTPTQYVSQYHVLETIACNDHPITHGVGAHRDNGDQISKWCKKEYVGSEFEKLVAKAPFRYIILSYSDAGIMPKEFIEKVLKRYSVEGSYEFHQIDFVKYKSARAVNREIADNTRGKKHFEWLFFIEKKAMPLYISPLNYIGGKYEVIPLIKENIPKNIHTFYDLFGGGGTVSINIWAERVIYNDINPFVKDLLQTIANNDIGATIKYITKTIKKYGLVKANKEAYYRFREHYNGEIPGRRNPLDLFLLICFGFEHQIRFNSKYDFNNPCGNSGYNNELQEKLISYNMRAQSMPIEYYSNNYLDWEAKITNDDFVYCDPPYLISCGAYNDGKRGFNGWDEEQEEELLQFLTRLNQRGVRFMLSNMVDRNGMENHPLRDWIVRNNFRVIQSPTITKRNRQNRREILILNY